MSGLAGFSDNPFRSRADLLRAATAIIKPLERYRSKLRARVKLYPSTAAGFDDVSAQLEGFARPLWAISTLFDEGSDPASRSWLQGIEHGVDPDSPEYWGRLVSLDQRMVEMESIAFALLIAPESILSLLSPESKTNLVEWLAQINHHEMPQNNWRWFRILVNLALIKALGSDKEKARQFMDQDFALLDQFYLGEGWSSDGIWGDDRKQADYYSGSFAIQFAQLLYIHFADDGDERVSKYRQQALDFASEYWRFFDTDGAAIPFGRSMTYRFACGAFWAAFALADNQSTGSSLSLGTVKGLLLRHLRWWSMQPEMFNSDGTMNIGFTYPNMYLSEDYNSRQSVYWCLKSFVVLGLQSDHPFWNIREEPHPMEVSPIRAFFHPSPIRLFAPAHQILCHSPEHHYLLSAGQMTTKSFKAREAKYGKFAYSSSFGFSVPTGLELHQIAPDSTLAIRFGDSDSWTVRCHPVDVRIETVPIKTKHGSADVASITSTWKPKKLDFRIRTTLVPLAPHYPGWHVRVHHITGIAEVKGIPWCNGVELVDSSFAINAWTEKGYHITSAPGTGGRSLSEAYSVNTSSVHIKSRSGSSGIIDLTPRIVSKGSSSTKGYTFQGRGHVIRADPNTNLIAQRTFIPSILYTHHLSDQHKEESFIHKDVSILLATGVFGVGRKNMDVTELSRMWNHRPSIEVDTTVGGVSMRVI